MAEATDDPGQTPSRQMRSIFNGSALAVVASIQERLRPVCSGDMAAQQEAWWLLESATGRSRTRLVADGACVFDDTARRFVEYALTERIEKQKPIEYVLGAVAFCGFAFEIAEPVLIPRQETEEWVLQLVKVLKEKIPSNVKFSILDACTGSGCIGLVLASAFPNATIIGIDVSAEAITLAERNKQRFGINNITFIKCSVEEFMENTHKTFDLVVSNPPYLSQVEFVSASVECPSLKWESQLALIGGDDGLYFYRQILGKIKKILSDKFEAVAGLPRLVLEIGYAQGEMVKRLAEREGFFCSVQKDSFEKDRIVMCE